MKHIQRSVLKTVILKEKISIYFNEELFFKKYTISFQSDALNVLFCNPFSLLENAI